MNSIQILYVIAALNGAALIVAIAASVEVFKFFRKK